VGRRETLAHESFFKSCGLSSRSLRNIELLKERPPYPKALAFIVDENNNADNPSTSDITTSVATHQP
jgi:hypothetical protein